MACSVYEPPALTVELYPRKLLKSYAVFKLAGKQIRRSLKTSVLEMANVGPLSGTRKFRHFSGGGCDGDGPIAEGGQGIGGLHAGFELKAAGGDVPGGEEITQRLGQRGRIQLAIGEGVPETEPDDTGGVVGLVVGAGDDELGDAGGNGLGGGADTAVVHGGGAAGEEVFKTHMRGVEGPVGQGFGGRVEADEETTQAELTGGGEGAGLKMADVEIGRAMGPNDGGRTGSEKIFHIGWEGLGRSGVKGKAKLPQVGWPVRLGRCIPIGKKGGDALSAMDGFFIESFQRREAEFGAEDVEGSLRQPP